ncbi:MAG: metal ABC transporter permease [Thiomicrospira sp.]
MYELWIYLTLALVAASCALMGSVLLLRRMSMLGDAISHSVLLGLVLTYLFIGYESLSAMLLGATLVGLFTAWLSEWIHRQAQLSADASLGFVFTWLFAIAVILISLFAEQTQLDQDHVLFGEAAFIPFTPFLLFDLNLGPRGFWLALMVFLLNALLLAIAYERIKLASFQLSFALSLGIQAGVWHYLIMGLVSITAVSSFDAVGAILVVALLVLPAASAYLVATRLAPFFIYALGYGQLAVLIGLGFAYWLDTVISASIAAAAAALLMLTLLIQAWRGSRPA